MTYVIGLDLGTTSTKAVVFDLDGNVISEHGIEYPILTPQPAWAEQDPEVIFSAVIGSLREAVDKSAGSSIIGVGISSAMHSLILIDSHNQPMTNTIIWADNRATEQADQLRNGDGREIYLRTGTPIHPMSPLTKILWFKENRPDLFSRTSKFISIKEYLLFRLFGEYLIDYSIASATGLFNLENLDFDASILSFVGIKNEQLSTPVNTTYVLQGMEGRYAQAIGLDRNLPFIIGGSDGCLANLGIGALEEGEIAITIGTSGAIRSVVSTPIIDPKQRTFCYFLANNHWVIGGPTNNGGILLRWFRDRFATGVSYNKLALEAAAVPAGSEGLLCLPYLSGERAPIWNANARGCFVGMSLHHERKHFVRSAMEGVIYSIYGVGLALHELSGDFKSLKASGGFVQSPLWCQILADVFGTQVSVPQSHQSSSWGAAILTLYALGEIDQLSAKKHSLPQAQIYIPHSDAHRTYQTLFKVYEEVYSSLVNSFDTIAGFQKSY